MKKEIDWTSVLSTQEDFDKYLGSLGHERLSWYKKVYDFFRYTIPFTVGDFLFECKMKYQIVTRGYSDRNVWGLCDDMARLNIKLLTQLRDHGHGYPNGLTEKKWKAILTKMILGFEAHLILEELSGFNTKLRKKTEKQFEEGMELYAQWYKNLWD